MNAHDAIGQTACPDCGADIPVHHGLRTWCTRCNWNLGTQSQPTEEGVLARQYARIGERYGRTLLDTLKTMPPQQLRPHWTVRKGVAFLLAASVHLLSLAMLAVGIFVIVSGFPQPFPMLLGAAACAFAWIMRPRPGQVPRKDMAGPEEYPALHALANEVARKLGGQPINHIIVTEDFNAAYAVVGWRGIPVLWIGLPLWMALRAQERLAVLGHEVAHGVNGDATRSFIMGSALNALDGWISLLRGPLHHARTSFEILSGYVVWTLSIPIASTQSLLAHLLWLDKQQAEYFADCLGSTIAGTDAAMSTLQRTGCAEHLEDVLLHSAYSTSQSGAYILALFRERIANLPDREWQRLARASERAGARLDASHPPTGHRLDFLRAHRVAEPGLVADAGVMAAIDSELAAAQERIGHRLIARYARD